MTASDYDAVILVASPVGENLADRIVQRGLSVTILEAELVGGERSRSTSSAAPEAPTTEASWG
jgi:dihydrolipoamide dehydrogenase